jgi:hypothetical protein
LASENNVGLPAMIAIRTMATIAILLTALRERTRLARKTMYRK